MHSFLKYTGSKKGVAAELASKFPPHSRFVDLTVGGGSILLHSDRPKLISDINEHVIRAYLAVKDNPQVVKNHYNNCWNKLQTNSEFYYEVRNRFNVTQQPEDFIFLTRTCYNGLIRFNSDGKFNVSFNLTRKGMEPKKFNTLVDFWHPFLQNVEVCCGDYEEVYLPQAQDFVFIDSPYLATKGQYLSNKFDFNRLRAFIVKLDSLNIKFMCCLDGGINKDFMPFNSFSTTTKHSSLSRRKGIKDRYYKDTVFTNV